MKNRPTKFLIVLIIFFIMLTVWMKKNGDITCPDEQYLNWAVKTVNTVLQRHPDYIFTYESDRSRHKWHYEQGLMLNALYSVYQATGDSRYLDFIGKNIDIYVNEDGEINTYKMKDFKLDDIGPGRALLRLYQATGNAKYKLAAEQLRQQLTLQPRTSEDGFWHKKIYPWQMWLDGLYMAAPFYAVYEKEFAAQPDYADIINQFQLIYSKTLDLKSGLLYHGWDEKKEQIWANLGTGLSQHFWGRGIGWYLMALADVLEILPEETPNRDVLIVQFQGLAKAVANVRDPATKVWYQVLNMGERKGNYLESSASAMFIYSFAKGANQGYLSPDYFILAEESFSGFLKQFISVSDSGFVDVLHACSGAGLGGKDQRDGSFEYYISEPQRTNDYKAVGPFILAAVELGKRCQNSSE